MDDPIDVLLFLSALALCVHVSRLITRRGVNPERCSAGQKRLPGLAKR